eukprot:13098782-Heterocapsa_arctica.AAC.1
MVIHRGLLPPLARPASLPTHSARSHSGEGKRRSQLGGEGRGYEGRAMCVGSEIGTLTLNNQDSVWGHGLYSQVHYASCMVCRASAEE